MVSSEIYYDRHAIRKLEQKHISKELVESVLLKPDTKLPSTSKGTNRWRKKFGNKWLYVIFKRRNNKILVVTEFWR